MHNYTLEQHMLGFTISISVLVSDITKLPNLSLSFSNYLQTLHYIVVFSVKGNREILNFGIRFFRYLGYFFTLMSIKN